MTEQNTPSQQSDNPYQSETLDAIRKRIDELDNRIHDTLMERAELVLQIGEEKRKKNIQIVQPAREARMIRRLLGRHRGALPEMAVVRIWRELVGAVSLLQTGLKVAVATPEGQHEYWDLARDYFGSCLPMQKMSSPVLAISAVREDRATFAVVPKPKDDDDQPWWTFLGPNSPEAMFIIMALPHGEDPDAPRPDHQALVVSKSGFDESGQDNSFLLIQCEPTLSRARLVDLAKKSGLVPVALSSRRNGNPSLPSCHLMEVEDYVARDDGRLSTLLKSLEDAGASIHCVGGYPVPPVYARSVKSPEALPITAPPAPDPSVSEAGGAV